MTRSTYHILLASANLVGFIAVVTVNALANAIPIAGRTTGELSDALPNLFVPAGLTFSIWGVIYLLLALFVGYGLVLSIRRRRAATTVPDAASDPLTRVGVLFLASCSANIGWIFAWHYRLLPLSLLLMAALLISLILIYLRLEVGRSNAAAAEKYLVHLPFSVYLGWISIATIANVTALLVAYDWGGFGLGDQVWASVMIAVGLTLGLIAVLHRNDVFYALVVVWALLGILIKRTADGVVPAQAVIATAALSAAVLLLAVIIRIARRRVYR